MDRSLASLARRHRTTRHIGRVGLSKVVFNGLKRPFLIEHIDIKCRELNPVHFSSICSIKILPNLKVTNLDHQQIRDGGDVGMHASLSSLADLFSDHDALAEQILVNSIALLLGHEHLGRFKICNRLTCALTLKIN